MYSLLGGQGARRQYSFQLGLRRHFSRRFWRRQCLVEPPENDRRALFEAAMPYAFSVTAVTSTRRRQRALPQAVPPSSQPRAEAGVRGASYARCMHACSCSGAEAEKCHASRRVSQGMGRGRRKLS